jgi:hypothetical protein
MLPLVVDVHTISITNVLTESTGNLRKMLATGFIVMLVATFTFALLPLAEAPNVAITYVIPSSHHGKVGDKVSVIGTTNTTNGLYRIWLGNSTVVPDTAASGTTVNATFTVPLRPQGNYTLILQDIAKNNATSWFIIDPTYSLLIRDATNNTIETPRQLQESDSITIWLNATGAKASTAYAANVTIMTPSPDNKTSWRLENFTTTATGQYYNLLSKYPDSFKSSPNTNLTGTYSVALNKTQATATFKTGLTNSTQYHRNQNVDIKAAHYNPGGTAKVKVLFGTEVKKNDTVSVGTDGLVHANWTVPSTAAIGTYTVNITSIPTNATVKNPRDVQTFTIPGFTINMTARNLAGEPVRNVAIKIFENGKSAANLTSNTNGLVTTNLETGIYTCNATYKNKKVAERTINVTAAASLDLNCSLTNLKILVTTQTSILVPEVRIYLTPENLTLTTNATGIAVAHSLLPNASLTSTIRPYVLNASRYGKSFNVTTLQTLLVSSVAVKYFNVTITCPTLTLRVNVINAEGHPIEGATVKVQELIGGLYDERTTNASGDVTFNFIFGKYTVGIYDADGIKVNETTVTLFQNQNTTILCKLYGLAITVKIIDFFGNPISNMHIILEREGMTARPSETQADGATTFNAVTGGTFHVTVYMTDPAQPCVEEGFIVDKSTTIQIKLDKYVMLAGSLVETSQFATVLIIALTLILVALLEVYRRWRQRPKQTEHVSQNQ